MTQFSLSIDVMIFKKNLFVWNVLKHIETVVHTRNVQAKLRSFDKRKRNSARKNTSGPFYIHSLLFIREFNGRHFSSCVSVHARLYCHLFFITTTLTKWTWWNLRKKRSNNTVYSAHSLYVYVIYKYNYLFNAIIWFYHLILISLIN